jgi:hypothetical protein
MRIALASIVITLPERSAPPFYAGTKTSICPKPRQGRPSVLQPDWGSRPSYDGTEVAVPFRLDHLIISQVFLSEVSPSPST